VLCVSRALKLYIGEEKRLYIYKVGSETLIIMLIIELTTMYNYSTYRTDRVPTRSVRQVRVYAFGAPTTRLRVWCTPEALTNQGEVASVYRPHSLLQYKRQLPPSQRVYDTIRISCPGI